MIMGRLLVATVLLLIWAAPAWAVPPVRKVVSDGGIEAWLIEDHTHPVVHLSLSFRGGAALDPADRGGLASLLASLLDEGAGDLDSQAFQGRLEDLAVELSFEAGRDGLHGTLKTLTRNLDPAADLLRLALTAPRFDREPVARMRAAILARLERAASNPDDIARRAFQAAMFPDHPYGRPAAGDPDGVARITVEDLRGALRDRLARDALVVGVFGDITPDRLRGLLDQVFGGLPATAATGAIRETKAAAGGRLRVIARDIPQSVILFGHGGPKREDPDFYAATVLTHILGGGTFSSRLHEEIREKRGLAYSVGLSLWPLDHAGLILGSAGTANERAAETVEILRREWSRMRESGATAQEVDDARTYLTGSFPLRFLSGSRIARMLVGMQVHDLGIDYLDRRNGLISAVTRADVARVARRLLDPARLEFVVVGRPEGLAPADDGPT